MPNKEEEEGGNNDTKMNQYCHSKINFSRYLQ